MNNFKLGVNFNHILVNDFYTPSESDFDAFSETLDNFLNKGDSVAVHCGAGNGRTGTYLAAYWIKQSIGQYSTEAISGNKYKKRLSNFDFRESLNIRFVWLSWLIAKICYNIPESAADPDLSRMVLKAVEFVKKGSPEAIETPDQLAALQQYAEYLQRKP